MSVYILQINSQQSTTWPETLVYIHFTLLVYDPEQLSLPHWTYMFHCTTPEVYIQMAHISKKWNFSLPCHCHIYSNIKYVPQMPHMKLVHVSYVSIYTSYELTEVNNVTRNTHIHTFKIIDIYLWTNMPATAFVLTLYLDPTLAHISVTYPKNATLIY